jgi:hypothetical protein
MKHNCGGTTVPKQREIVTRPDDNCWPRNNYIYVPYCTVCKIVVSVTECREPEPSSPEKPTRGVKNCHQGAK